MLEISKPKIILSDLKLKIVLNNNVIKIIRTVSKEMLLYSQ